MWCERVSMRAIVVSIIVLVNMLGVLQTIILWVVYRLISTLL